MKRKNIKAGTRLWKVEKNFSRKIVIKSGINPSLIRESPTKGTHVYPRFAMIGILIPELRENVK